MIFGDRFDIPLQLMLCGKQDVAEKIVMLICNLPPGLISDVRSASSNNDKFEVNSKREFPNGTSYVYNCNIIDNKLIINVVKAKRDKRIVSQTFLVINSLDKEMANKLEKIDLGYVSFMDGTQTLRAEGAPIIDFTFKRGSLFSQVILTSDDSSKVSLVSNKLFEEAISSVMVDDIKQSSKPKHLIRRKSKRNLFY